MASMNVKSAARALAGTAVACATVAALTPSVDAEILSMPGHERTFTAPGEAAMKFTVGSRDETINRIPPLNFMGTTREALVSTVAYGRLNGATGGKLRMGYHVGCAVTIGAGTMGMSPDIIIAQNPAFNPNPLATLNLSPGEVGEIALAEKEMIPGKLIQVSVRDFHIKVNSCTGPVMIRQYAYVDAKSPEVDDSGAVFGDPTWL
ncbi:MspA family porin [Nocardia altamirensis]|uniref:MspA family porin n=1 Tax=Nocardia altamirensis TaxID=472158 RepID=UPI001FDED924|nr:MspA family porin [Nocardia altamirensis]